MEFSYEITREVGVLSEKPNGWRREVNMISWNGADPKIDIRDWAPEHSKMSKGISLTYEEALELSELLKTVVNE